MLDIACVLLTVALFAVLALTVRAAEKLCAQTWSAHSPGGRTSTVFLFASPTVPERF
jgi:hypothetical protein